MTDKSKNAGDAAENDKAGSAKESDDTEIADDAESVDSPKD